MNKNEKRAYEIMELGKKLTAEKRRKTAIIRRTAFSVSGLCAAAAVGFGIWNSSTIKEAADFGKLTSHDTITEAVTEAPASDAVIVTTAAENAADASVQTSAVKDVPSDPGVQTSAENNSHYTSNSRPSALKNSPSGTDVQKSTNTAAYAGAVQTTAVTAASQAAQTTAAKTSLPVLTDNMIFTTHVTAKTGVQTAQTTAIMTEPVVTTIDEGYHGNGGESPDEYYENKEPYCYCNIREFLGNEYISAESVEVQPENIGEFICETIVDLNYCNGYKGHDENITAIAEVYSVKDFSENFAIAVKYQDNDTCYIYKNLYYFPETLGDLIKDCCFEDHLTIKKDEYYCGNDLKYNSLENIDILDMLFDDRTVRAHKYTYFSGHKSLVGKVTLLCDMPEMFSTPFNIGISVDGLLLVNLHGNAIAFDIGKDKTDRFLELVLNEQ